MTINTKAPEGNVYCILGVFKQLTKDLKAAGCDVTEHEFLLKEKYRTMRYDEILDEIERLTNGSIKFSGRAKEKAKT